MNDKGRESEAMVSLLKDVIEYKRREAKFLFAALVVCLVLNFLQMAAFLIYESQFEYGDATVTTTEQTVDGDDGSIVNGDQYNDKSKNQSGGDKK